MSNLAVKSGSERFKEPLNKLISFMPFDFAQESVRQAQHEGVKLKKAALITMAPVFCGGLKFKFYPAVKSDSRFVDAVKIRRPVVGEIFPAQVNFNLRR